ncbi:MAG: hypothetical protein WCO04_15170 [Pseudomonadota bacterium]
MRDSRRTNWLPEKIENILESARPLGENSWVGVFTIACVVAPKLLFQT